jgi:uncharacterized protein YjcR
MARSRSPNRDKSFEIYKEHHGEITTKEIARLLDEKEKNIEYWRSVDNWNKRYNPNGGAPLGNQNAAGHIGVAPTGNQNARKEGWYSKYFPIQSRNLIKEAEESGGSPLEILWAQIITQWVAIIRAQEIMFVTDKNEMIKEVKKHKEHNKSHTRKTGAQDEESSIETEWEFQFAWDRQATFLNAQSRAMAQLTNMIKKYEELLKDDLSNEEQRLRIEKLKTNINTTNMDIQNRKKIAEEKLKLEKERFEHQKKMDESKVW